MFNRNFDNPITSFGPREFRNDRGKISRGLPENRNKPTVGNEPKPGFGNPLKQLDGVRHRMRRWFPCSAFYCRSYAARTFRGWGSIFLDPMGQTLKDRVEGIRDHRLSAHEPTWGSQRETTRSRGENRSYQLT